MTTRRDTRSCQEVDEYRVALPYDNLQQLCLMHVDHVRMKAKEGETSGLAQ